VKTESSIYASPDMALKILAHDTRTSREEVERIYETECAKLAAGARIRTFIPALALRKARARLRNRRH
jgi:phosphopentomutase